MDADDGLGGGVGGGLLRFGAFLAAAAVLALGLLARGDAADRRWLLALAVSAPFFVILFWPRLPRALPAFNRTVVRLGTLLVVAFLLTNIHLVRIQVVRGADGQSVATVQAACRGVCWAVDGVAKLSDGAVYLQTAAELTWQK